MSLFIGAGPYGLSTCGSPACAWRRYPRFGFPMQSWRDFHASGMKLKSEGLLQIFLTERCIESGTFCREMNIPYADTTFSCPRHIRVLRRSISEAVCPDLEKRGGVGGAAPHVQSQLEDGEVVAARRTVIATALPLCLYPLNCLAFKGSPLP